MHTLILGLWLLVFGNESTVNALMARIGGPRPLLLLNENLPSPFTAARNVRVIERAEFEQRIHRAESATIVELSNSTDHMFVIDRGQSGEWNRFVAVQRENGELAQERTEWWLADESRETPLRLEAGMTAPVATKQVDPDYSELARRNRTSGLVILQLHIEKSGRVSHIETLKGLPDGVTTAAIEATRHWEFKPALRDGTPIDVVCNLTVAFKLK